MSEARSMQGLLIRARKSEATLCIGIWEKNDTSYEDVGGRDCRTKQRHFVGRLSLVLFCLCHVN